MNPANLSDRQTSLKRIRLNSTTEKSIAKSGFYLEKNNNAVCFCCNIQVDLDELKNGNPHKIHIERQVNCDFIQKPMQEECDEEVIIGEPKFPSFSTYEDRLKSFDEWPIQIIAKEELTKNGFFYTGNADKVQCYHCGSTFKHWVEGDKPLEEHARGYQDCAYLKLVKGEKFIQDILMIHGCNEEIDDQINDVEDFVDDAATNQESDECNICYKSDSKVLLIPCGHIGCNGCSLQVLNCPMCRTLISLRQPLSYDTPVPD